MSDKEFLRDSFINEMLTYASIDKDIVFISADFGAPALDSFRENLPSQFFHSGISEQHMVDMAAGFCSFRKKSIYLRNGPLYNT